MTDINVKAHIRIILDEKDVYRDPEVQRLLDVRRATVVITTLHGARQSLQNAEASQTITGSNEWLNRAKSTIGHVIGLRGKSRVHGSMIDNTVRSQIILIADNFVRNAIQAQRGIGFDAGKTAHELKIETVMLLRSAIDEINKLI